MQIDGIFINVIYFFIIFFKFFCCVANNHPAPGSYCSNNSLLGNLYNSKYRSGSMITISQKFKNSDRYRDETPGPGSYLHFSEFGVLAPKNYKRNNIRKVTTNKNLFKQRIIKRVLSEDRSLIKGDKSLSGTE